MMSALNYATQYAKALAEAYPYTLYFGRLWSNENASKYKVVDANTIKIPTLTTTGRVNGTRDSIGSFARNFDNDWETKTLKQHRCWNTLVHPRDIDETNQVVSIMNITKIFNEEQKFPEMDAYTVSQLYSLKNALETINQEAEDLTVQNVLTKFDELMDKMDEARVPSAGRILYVDTYTKTLIDNAIALTRSTGQKAIVRNTSRLEEVEIVSVPTTMMKTEYTFTTGWQVGGSAKDIAMMLVHPSCIIPAVNYEFSQLESPSALSQGKYVYYEESFEDIFLLNKRHAAIQFVVKKDA